MDFGKVLVVDDIEAVREIIIFYLRSLARFTPLEASSGKDAIEKIKKNQDIDFIICDQNMPDGTGLDFYHEIRKFSKMPFIMHTTDPSVDFQVYLEDENFLFLEKPTEINQLKKILLSIANAHHTAEGLSPETEKYFPVQVSLVRKIGETKVPLYIRISENKYVKIQNEGKIEDDFLFDKEINTLYLKQNDFHKYITEYQQKIQTTLDNPKLKTKQSVQHLLTTAELIQIVQNKLGISEEIKALVEKNIQYVCRLSMNLPAPQQIAEEVLNSSASFNSKHIILTSLIGTAIGKKLNWLNDKTSVKFVFASILHDSTLNSAQGDIEFQIDRKNLPYQYKNHPIHAAEIARNWKACPTDVPTIIEQHHELPDGSGFPQGLQASRIIPLAAVFIVAHDLAVSLTIGGHEFSIPNWIETHKMKYSNGDFKKSIDSIQDMYLNCIMKAS